MKNSNIHNGLDKKEVRDFLSTSFVNLVIDEMNNKQSPPTASKSTDAFDWAIRSAESLIKYGTRQLEILRTRQGLLAVIKQNGWEEFDVSEETELDGETKHYKPFIGNKSEYTNLLGLIQKEKVTA